MKKVWSFRIDDGRLEELRRAAEVRGVSVSQIIRRGAVREARVALGRRRLEAEGGGADGHQQQGGDQ